MVQYFFELTKNKHKFYYSNSTAFKEASHKLRLLKIEGKLTTDNVTAKNNRLAYYKTNVDENNNPTIIEKEIKVPPRFYKLEELLQAIKENLPQDDTKLFTVQIRDDNRIVLKIDQSYCIDFTKDNSLNNVLGFDKVKLTPGKKVAPREFQENITTVKDVFLKCNLIENNYINEKTMPYVCRLTDFNKEFKKSTTGAVFNIKNNIDEIEFSFVDINNNLVDMAIDIKLEILIV